MSDNILLLLKITQVIMASVWISGSWKQRCIKGSQTSYCSSLRSEASEAAASLLNWREGRGEHSVAEGNQEGSKSLRYHLEVSSS